MEGILGVAEDGWPLRQLPSLLPGKYVIKSLFSKQKVLQTLGIPSPMTVKR